MAKKILLPIYGLIAGTIWFMLVPTFIETDELAKHKYVIAIAEEHKENPIEVASDMKMRSNELNIKVFIFIMMTFAAIIIYQSL